MADASSSSTSMHGWPPPASHDRLRDDGIMATQLDSAAEARARLTPYVEELIGIIRSADPDVTYSVEPAPDDGIWLLNVFLAPPLDDDLDLHGTVTDRAVDFQVDDDVSIAVIPHRRRPAVSGPGRSDKS